MPGTGDITDPDADGLPSPEARRALPDLPWRRAWRAIVDLIVPPSCPACGARTAEPTTLCPACWRETKRISRPFCERLALPFSLDPGSGTISPAALAHPPRWDRARAAVLYEGPPTQLVTALKFGDRLEVAPCLASEMARAGADILREADAMVPVPLHPRRLFQRRFNQAAVLAHGVSKRSGVPVLVDVLRRVKPTPPQVGLTKEGRARNVVGAFAVPARRRDGIAGKRLILVDDVLTTGATLEACARVLNRAGAASVDVLVCARVGEVIATEDPTHDM
jgi:ComF family protein